MRKHFSLGLVIVILISNIVFYGCEKSKEHQPNKEELTDSSLIRNKNIDAASLDLNKDGKLYQCPMHFNVISDSAGTCPLCKMDLEEYTVQEAKNNLL